MAVLLAFGPLACDDAPPAMGTTSGSTTHTAPGTSTTTAPEPGEVSAGDTTGAPPTPPRDIGSTPDVGTPPADLGGGTTETMPSFTDVTIAAGLDLDPGQLVSAPFCSLDNIASAPGIEGDYCLPDRHLGSVAIGDFDNDGWPDIYLTRIQGPDWLLRNGGDGTFEDVAADRGLTEDHHTGGVAWIDVEGDGDLDLMLTTVGDTRHYLYINDGSGHFEDQGLLRGAALATGSPHVGTSVGVGDYDLDGYLDMFVAEWRSTFSLGDGPDHNRLLHNLGAANPGHFEDVTAAVGIDLQAVSAEIGTLVPGAWGFAPAFVDLDDDGYPELTVVSDYGTSRLWHNNGDGSFTDWTEAAGVGTDDSGMGSTFGDFDGDGDLDWFVSAISSRAQQYEGNRMYRNEGGLVFVDVTDELGLRDGRWAWGATMFDPDRDGDLDVALAAGYPKQTFFEDPLRLWHNQGDGPWPEVAVASGIDYTQQGRGLVAFDYDRDGDLDLLVHSNTESPALFRNDVETNGWLTVQLQGTGGNPRGLGARVTVQAEPDGPTQVQQIGVGSHLFGHGESTAFFGLGNGAAPVHRVEVHWPALGETVVRSDVRRNQALTLTPSR